MIKTSFHTTRNDGVELYRTYSTDGMKICKIGTDEIYDEAIDVADAHHVYEELSIPIDKAEDVETPA